MRRHVGPGVGVREEGGGVEEVAAERGDEEEGGEAGCALAGVVFVELGWTGGEVEEGREPGEDAAGDFEGCSVGACVYRLVEGHIGG